MVCRLSIMNPLVMLFFCAAMSLRANVTIAPVRQSGAPLDPSLRNEAGHAVRQAADWLAAHQNADGSWGGTNRVRFTSLALLALSVSHHPGFSEPCARAVLWLDRDATNRLDCLDTQAWRLLALLSALQGTTGRTNALCRFAKTTEPPTDTNSETARFWAEALSAAGLASLPPEPAAARDRLVRVADTWPPPPALSTATAWQLAHLINRTGGGQLVRGNTPLDWRTDLTQRLINTQRRASDIGGYWAAATLDGTIAETAFGILALLEL